MGMLAENKSRRKISNDPNNTKWTRDETTFGQKILRSQGWQPGQFLGAQNAPHSELHTAANASYIRVVLKDDMKGLGFNKAKEDEVTGLDVFSDLLSRLNGRSEESIESDKAAKLAVKTNFYVEQKYGAMRFVSGGLLVGDKLVDSTITEEDEEEKEADSEGDAKMEDVPAMAETKKSKKDKKRKASEDEDDEDDSSSKKRRRKDEDKSKKEKKKSKKDKSRSEPASEDEDAATADKKKRKSKNSRDNSEDDDDTKDSKKKSKKEKKEKKERKKEKKEKKKRRKAAGSSDDDSSDSSSSDKNTGTSTPVTSGSGAGTGTSTPLGNRNFVRSRFIAQKKQAVLDAKALNQIFMLKT
ncbi:telomerase inhibitor [Lecanicillium sp. MT-2017a]|nr:telomerase inhibitor [Lecanicillium sp. MT-2017a]